MAAAAVVRVDGRVALVGEARRGQVLLAVRLECEVVHPLAPKQRLLRGAQRVHGSRARAVHALDEAGAATAAHEARELLAPRHVGGARP